jgi:hypothetical protein
MVFAFFSDIWNLNSTDCRHRLNIRLAMLAIMLIIDVSRFASWPVSRF